MQDEKILQQILGEENTIQKCKTNPYVLSHMPVEEINQNIIKNTRKPPK